MTQQTPKGRPSEISVSISYLVIQLSDYPEI